VNDTVITMALRAVTGPTGWVACGWTGGIYQMVGSDAVIGWSGDSPSVGAYSLTGQDPSLILPIPIPITNNYTEIVNDTTTIIFTRVIAAGNHPINNSMNGTNAMIGAIGGTDYLTQHVYNAQFLVEINYVTGQVSVIPQSSPLKLAHGSIMFIAWSCVIPFGIIFARYGKKIPDAMWFKVHQAIMPTGYGIVLIGFIIAIVMVNGSHFNTVWHAQLGYALCIAPCLQVLYGIFRPHKEKDVPITPARAVFEVVHPWYGRILLVTAIIQTFGGILQYKLEYGGSFVIIGVYAGYIGIIVIIVVVLELLRDIPSLTDFLSEIT